MSTAAVMYSKLAICFKSTSNQQLPAQTSTYQTDS